MIGASYDVSDSEDEDADSSDDESDEADDLASKFDDAVGTCTCKHFVVCCHNVNHLNNVWRVPNAATIGDALDDLEDTLEDVASDALDNAASAIAEFDPSKMDIGPSTDGSWLSKPEAVPTVSTDPLCFNIRQFAKGGEELCVGIPPTHPSPIIPDKHFVFFSFSVLVFAGPVPVTFSIEAGGSVGIGFFGQICPYTRTAKGGVVPHGAVYVAGSGCVNLFVISICLRMEVILMDTYLVPAAVVSFKAFPPSVCFDMSLQLIPLQLTMRFRLNVLCPYVVWLGFFPLILFKYCTLFDLVIFRWAFPTSGPLVFPLFSSCEVKTDRSPPALSSIEVRQLAANSLSLAFDAKDADSGVTAQWWGIGSQPNSADVYGLRSLTTLARAAVVIDPASIVRFAHAATLYIMLCAQNGDGVRSCVSSPSIIWRMRGPLPINILDGYPGQLGVHSEANGDAIAQRSPSTLGVQWSFSAIDRANLVELRLAVGTCLHCANVLKFAPLSDDAVAAGSYSFPIALLHNTRYFVSLTGVDALGQFVYCSNMH